MRNKVVESAHIVGRKPSKNPLRTLISFRVDDSTAKGIDDEIAHEMRQPGVFLNRGDMVRRLVAEALEARQRRKRTK